MPSRLEEVEKEIKDTRENIENLVGVDGIILDEEQLEKERARLKELEAEAKRIKLVIEGFDFGELGQTPDKEEIEPDLDTDNGRIEATPLDKSPEEVKCEKDGGTWDAVNGTCILPEDVKTAYNEYVKVIEGILDKVTQKRQEAIDKELEANQDRQDQLRELAARGVQDADNNLAEAERQQAELERQKEEALQRQARIELALSALSTYTAKVQAGDDNALASTIADTQLLLNFVQSLPAFYEGTENTGLGGDVDNKGGFHAILHPNERVMTAEQNKQLDGLSNWELSNLGAMWKSGELMQPTVVTQDNSEMINLLTDIKNKPTYLGRDYDKTERAIIETVIRQGRKERNHRKTGANGIW